MVTTVLSTIEGYSYFGVSFYLNKLGMESLSFLLFLAIQPNHFLNHRLGTAVISKHL